MNQYYSAIIDLETSEIFHFPHNSCLRTMYSGAVQKRAATAHNQLVDLHWWNCKGEFKLENVVSSRNNIEVSNLSKRNRRAIKSHFVQLKELHENPVSPEPDDTFYGWEYTDVWLRLDLPGLGEMLSDTSTEIGGVYPFKLDLWNYSHNFYAPLLKGIQSLSLKGDAPFEAPALTHIGDLFLYDYKGWVNAPSLKNVGRMETDGYPYAKELKEQLERAWQFDK